MIYNLWCIEVPRGHKKRRDHLVWILPAIGVIMVNVGGSFLANPDKWGYQGVFNDSKGKVLCQFGKQVYVDSALHVKVFAFREQILVTIVHVGSHSTFLCSNMTQSRLLLRSRILYRLCDIFTMCYEL